MTTRKFHAAQVPVAKRLLFTVKLLTLHLKFLSQCGDFSAHNIFSLHMKCGFMNLCRITRLFIVITACFLLITSMYYTTLFRHHLVSRHRSTSLRCQNSSLQPTLVFLVTNVTNFHGTSKNKHCIDFTGCIQ